MVSLPAKLKLPAYRLLQGKKIRLEQFDTNRFDEVVKIFQYAIKRGK